MPSGTWLRWAAGAATLYGLWMAWRLRSLHSVIRRGGPWGPRWLGAFVASGMSGWAALNGVKVKSERAEEGAPADGSKAYIYVWHPHGFISFVPSFLMGGMAVAGRPHGRPWFGTCIGLLFKIPILGEIFSLTNARPVDRKTIESILRSGGTVAIQPGGVKEQARTREDQEQAFFPARLGFVKLAIQHGRPLLPLYLFGENQLYRRVNGLDWLTRFLHRLTGMTLPIVTAKFGIPMAGLLPIATDVHIRWGRPVEVGEQEADPSDERVKEVFERYLAELQRLFDANAHDCLPPAVAAKGLKIVRPGES